MLGIKCIKCGKDTKTTSTRSRDNSVYRRKECVECGFRFSTVESVKTLKVGRQKTDPLIKQMKLEKRKKLNDLLNEEREEPWFD